MPNNTGISNQFDVFIHSRKVWPFINQNNISEAQYGAICTALYRLARDCTCSLSDFLGEDRPQLKGFEKPPAATILRLVVTSKLQDEIYRAKQESRLGDHSEQVRELRRQMIGHLQTVLETTPEMVINEAVQKWLQRIQVRAANPGASKPCSTDGRPSSLPAAPQP